ncbi:uncharacterized protein LOC144433434 [Glandiceps talaboti]
MCKTDIQMNDNVTFYDTKKTLAGTRILILSMVVLMLITQSVADFGEVPVADFGEAPVADFEEVRPIEGTNAPGDLQRTRRFPKIMTCTTDMDCQKADRPACCARSGLGPFRVCKPLGGYAKTCNVYSASWPSLYLRQGHLCPCAGELSCKLAGSTSSLGICMY